MLKQRILTAIGLLAVLLPAIFYPNPMAFAVVAILLVATGAWEWAKLNELSSGAGLLAAFALALCCIGSWWFGLLDQRLTFLWVLTGATWVLGGAWLLRGGATAWKRVPNGARLAIGFLALWAAWLAIVQARQRGINFMISSMVLVWVADVFAYFAGRTFGGKLFSRKLAPTISPGKTWEGALGGLIGVLVVAFAWRSLDASSGSVDSSVFTELGEGGSLFLVLAVCFLSAMSVVGDLVESLFKRSAGVKDSSGLLPGHGGVLDRLDALLPVLPLIMMLTSV